MISTRLVELVIDTVVGLTLAKWETVSGQFGGYLNAPRSRSDAAPPPFPQMCLEKRERRGGRRQGSQRRGG